VMDATGWSASDAALQAWLQAVDQRWSTAWTQARERLDQQFENSGN